VAVIILLTGFCGIRREGPGRDEGESESAERGREGTEAEEEELDGAEILTGDGEDVGVVELAVMFLALSDSNEGTRACNLEWNSFVADL